MKKIDFYFDFLSPFSYFAWKNLGKIKEQVNDLQINYYPVIMGKLFQNFEIKGPGEVPPKRDFLFRQMIRYASKNNIPFTTPKSHPFNPLYALRVALKENCQSCQENQEEVIAALWQLSWNKQNDSETGIDMGDPDQLVAGLNRLGIKGEELLEKTYQREVKNALKNNIVSATEKGVFGVPSFVVDGELFWGNDSIETLIDYLNGEDNLDRDHYNKLRSNIVDPS